MENYTFLKRACHRKLVY